MFCYFLCLGLEFAPATIWIWLASVLTWVFCRSSISWYIFEWACLTCFFSLLCHASMWLLVCGPSVLNDSIVVGLGPQPSTHLNSQQMVQCRWRSHPSTQQIGYLPKLRHALIFFRNMTIKSFDCIQSYFQIWCLTQEICYLVIRNFFPRDYYIQLIKKKKKFFFKFT